MLVNLSFWYNGNKTLFEDGKIMNWKKKNSFFIVVAPSISFVSNERFNNNVQAEDELVRAKS
jgi:hypothetical protein